MTEYAVKVVLPVPPPATTAVPKIPRDDEPWEMNGTPDVADGDTLFNVPLAPPVCTLYCTG
jgi:hypothetical protein